MRHLHRVAPAAAATLAILAGSWLAGCATGDTGVADGTEASTTAASGTSTTEERTTVTTGDIDPGLQPYIDLAVADLATRRSIPAEDIIVRSATLEIWSDASLGCPKPGQQYAQVATDGSLIVLAADGSEFRYHAGGSRLPFLCEPPGKSLTSDPPTTL